MRKKSPKDEPAKTNGLEPEDADLLLGIVEAHVRFALGAALLSERNPTTEYLEACQIMAQLWRDHIKPGIRKQLIKRPGRGRPKKPAPGLEP